MEMERGRETKGERADLEKQADHVDSHTKNTSRRQFGDDRLTHKRKQTR